MAYLLPCLGDYDEKTLGEVNQAWLSFSAYFCAIAFVGLLCFALHNIVQYLVIHGKWKVFSLSIFYLLSVICLGQRIFLSLDGICAAQNLNVVWILFPAIIKMCIGIFQVAVIVEIAVRVLESIKTI